MTGSLRRRLSLLERSVAARRSAALKHARHETL
jgi:hypothetical protein